MFIPKSETINLVSVKLTNKGRELLTKGMNIGDYFDIVKFSFGDTEINYELIDENDLPNVMYPSSGIKDIQSKIYSYGVKPDGTPQIILSQNVVNLTRNQSGVFQTVRTEWLPVEGNYIEDYQWTNLGPLNDWDFKINKSVNKNMATFTSYNVAGTTRIRVKGMTSGAYTTFTLNIT
jgi:hypothetical protein